MLFHATTTGVRVAAGGGDHWRETTHAEAVLFLPAAARRRGVRERRQLAASESAPRKRQARQVRPCRAGGDQRVGDRWVNYRAQLAQRFSKCLPVPVPLAPAEGKPGTSSSSTSCPTADLHVARYGGRLLGGASSLPPPVLGFAPTPTVEGASSTTSEEEELIKAATTIEGMFEGCQYLPLFYLLKDDFGLGPVDISLTFGITMLPWAFKPLLAMVSDRVPIRGRRRTPYMAAGVFIMIGGLAGTSFLATSYSGTVFAITCVSLGRSLLGAAVQALLVECGRPRGHLGTTKLVGDFFLYRAGGALFSAVSTTIVVAQFGPRKAIKLALLLPASLLLAIARYELNKGADTIELQPAQVDVRSALNDLSVMFRQPLVWGPLVFLFIYNAGPNYDDPLYVYFINVLQFEPYMVGQLVVTHALAKVLGVFFYRYALRGIPDRTLIVGLTVMSCPLLLSPLLLTTGLYQTMHISPRLLALSGELIRELFVHLQMMPAMARWVELAPKRAEGTIMSLLTATMHVSRVVSKTTSAAVATGLGVTSTNFDHISLLIGISGMSSLLPVAFASHLIPNEVERSAPDADREQSDSGPAALADRQHSVDLSFQLRGDARIVPAG